MHPHVHAFTHKEPHKHLTTLANFSLVAKFGCYRVGTALWTNGRIDFCGPAGSNDASCKAV